MIRLLSLPGIQSLESALILDLPPKSPDEPSLAERLDVVSSQLFGITKFDTYIPEPLSDSAEAWETYEKLWDEREALIPDEAWEHPETIPFYRSLGWDVTDDFGQVARVLEHFYAQIVLSNAGIIGIKPTSSLTAWETQLAKQADAFAKAKKSEPWKPYRRSQKSR